MTRGVPSLFAIAIAIALASCATTSTPVTISTPVTTPTLTAPTAASSVPPTVASSAALSGEIRIPLDQTQFPALSDGEVLVTTRLLADGTTRLEAIDLASRTTTLLRDAVVGSVMPGAVRDGVFSYAVAVATAVPFQMRITIYAGRWRDPTTFVQLDDLVILLAGGDSWAPWPDPQTNGWEVAWMHAAAGDGTYELRIREADGRIHAPYTSKVPFSFALGRDGAVAIGEISVAGQTGPVALRLYAGGTTRALLERAPGSNGIVFWQARRLIWTTGIGVVVPISTVERLDTATLALETIAVPAGCQAFAGVTDDAIGYHCGDHVDVVSAAGRVSIGPPIPLLGRRAIMLDRVGSPRSASIWPIRIDDPRQGAGARF